MAKRNRQRWNFLVALVDQASEAMDEGSEEGAAFVSLIGTVAGVLGIRGADDSIAKLEQWLSQLDSRMDGLEQELSEDSGEDTVLDDDGDEDVDMERDEPPLERANRGLTRDPRTVRPSSGVQLVGRNRVSDGTSETAAIYRKKR